MAYVAKDPINQRGEAGGASGSRAILTQRLTHISPAACHILECCDGLAQSVISTVGQAFELRFKQYLHSPPAVVVPPERYQQPPPSLKSPVSAPAVRTGEGPCTNDTDL